MSQPARARAAVLGAGTMAPGIAVAFAEAGYQVQLWGRTPQRVSAALATVAEQAGFLHEHGLGGDGGEVAARVRRAESVAACAGADVVVEAISEDLAVKRSVFAALDRHCAEHTLLASTTSGLLVSDIAAGLRGAGRVVAMHFWNPAHLMPIVEIAGGERTDSVSIGRAAAIARQLGKLAVVLSREILGFLGVRMQQAVVREAIALLDAGVASAEHIDLAVRASFGVRFPAIGPLESADLSGLDVITAVHRYLLGDLDRSTRPQAGLRDRVSHGELGVKSGRGFYDWTARDAGEVARRRDEELVRRVRLLRDEGAIEPPGSHQRGNQLHGGRSR